MDVSVKVSLRRSLIKRLLDLPPLRLAEMKMGVILSRLTGDVDVITGILQKAVVFPAVSVIRLLIAGGILLILNLHLAGLLPVSSRALEEAIRLNGVDVEDNLAAFAWGRAARIDPGAVERALEPERRDSIAKTRTLAEEKLRSITRAA